MCLGRRGRDWPGRDDFMRNRKCEKMGARQGGTKRSSESVCDSGERRGKGSGPSHRERDDRVESTHRRTLHGTLSLGALEVEWQVGL